MGRKRRHNRDLELPTRVQLSHGAYYYTLYIDGKQRWIYLSRDLGAARRLAAEYTRVYPLRTRVSGIDQAVAAQAMERSDHRCVYCGATEHLGVDHIIPASSGGADAPFNLVAACRSCNSAKGQGDPVEFIRRATRLADIQRIEILKTAVGSREF